MIFISYEQWKAENQDLWEQVQKEMEECDVCQGDGYCWTCGSTCTHCSDPNDRMRKIYNERKDEQIRKWKEWQDCVGSLK